MWLCLDVANKKMGYIHQSNLQNGELMLLHRKIQNEERDQSDHCNRLWVPTAILHFTDELNYLCGLILNAGYFVQNLKVITSLFLNILYNGWINTKNFVIILLIMAFTQLTKTPSLCKRSLFDITRFSLTWNRLPLWTSIYLDLKLVLAVLS